jgi:hypothetical protein
VHVIDHVYTRQRLFGLVQSLHGRAGQGQSHPMRSCARVRARPTVRIVHRCQHNRTSSPTQTLRFTREGLLKSSEC